MLKIHQYRDIVKERGVTQKWFQVYQY